LAVESALEVVPELKQRLSSVSGLAKYFETIPSELTNLRQLLPEFRAFLGCCEVWFAEHVMNVTSPL
jgi:hypothetical protein